MRGIPDRGIPNDDSESTDELIAHLLAPAFCGVCGETMPSRWRPICDGCLDHIAEVARRLRGL